MEKTFFTEDGIHAFKSNAKEFVKEIINSSGKEINAEKFGLDSRLGKIIYIDYDQLIAVPSFKKNSIEYYGGFEYIPDEDKFELGGYCFYGSDERVTDAIEYYHENQVY